MDFPLLLVLLALPFAVAGVIVAVSVARRRSHAAAHEGTEPAHRLQADTAAVQDAAPRAADAAPRLPSGRERRAASGDAGEGH
jgi:hypothetical protein